MRQAALLSLMFFVFVSLMVGQSSNIASTGANNSQAVTNGVVTPATPTTPLVVRTPEVNLSNVQLTAGASNATADNQAGATNATADNQAGASNSTLQQSGTTPEVPAAYNSGNTSNAHSFGIATNSAWDVASGDQDVAAASRQARMHQAKDHPRLFTNDDIARLQNSNSPNGNAPTGPVTNQSTMPASDVMQPQSNSQPNVRPQAQQTNTMPPAPVRSPFRPKTAPQQSTQQPQPPQ